MISVTKNLPETEAQQNNKIPNSNKELQYRVVVVAILSFLVLYVGLLLNFTKCTQSMVLISLAGSIESCKLVLLSWRDPHGLFAQKVK